MPRKDHISTRNIAVAADTAATLRRLFPTREESSTIVLSCLRGDYSGSRIARAVEDCDAHLLNLNVTSDSETADNRIITEIRVSHRNPEHVARSLERYGYEVLSANGAPDMPDDIMQARYDELMHYLGL